MSWYDTKQSEDGAPLMLELWRMRCTPLLSSLPDPLWPGVVAPDRVLSRGQLELNSMLMLNWFAWNSTVYVFKKRDLALNNLQCLIFHKTKINQTNTSAKWRRVSVAVIAVVNRIGDLNKIWKVKQDCSL